MTYHEVIEELKQNGIACKKGDYFFYDDSPEAELYNSFWEACRNFLASEDLTKFFKYPRVYYSHTNINDKNAAAYLDGKYALVIVFAGLIHHISTLYNSAKTAFKEEFSSYDEVSRRFGISSERYLIEIVTSFVMYHETGHLIQRNHDAMSYFEFLAYKCENKSVIEERHVKEFDADWFASNRLAMQIMGLVTELYGEHNSEDKIYFLHNMTELALSSVYIFLVDFADGTPELYFDEKCHPHPSVRLTYIIFYFVDTVKFLAGIELDERRIIHNTIDVSMTLMSNKDPNPIEIWSRRIFNELADIDSYIKKVIADVKKYPECCYNRLPNNK